MDRATRGDSDAMAASIITRRALDAVERWAAGYLVFRELAAGLGVGRFDALLVPVSGETHCMRQRGGPFWGRPCLVGVEIKVSRADFLAGVRKGQYERYAKGVAGLYVATTQGVCKTSELPPSVGHLVILDKRPRLVWRAVCKRHPKYNQSATVPAAVAWDLIFRVHRRMHKRLQEQKEGQRRAMKKMGDRAGSLVFGALKDIQRQAAAAAAQTGEVK